MRIHLWSHGESFCPDWRARELAWIGAYAEQLRNKGFTVSLGASSAPPPSGTSVLHLFGGGHFETIRWARDHCSLFLFSPFPFSAPGVQPSAPEGRALALLKFAWRKARGGPDLTDRTALAHAGACLVPARVLPEARRWGIPAGRVLPAESPEELAARVRELSSRKELHAPAL